LKDNRRVDDSGDSKSYQQLDHLEWTKEEELHGKVIKGFPAEHNVKDFRVVLSTQRADYVATNKMEQQDNTEVVHDL
jgi:hypothetical protein